MAITQKLIKAVISPSFLTNHSRQLQKVRYLGAKQYSTSQKNLPVIYMFSKDNCSLCDDAKAVLEPYRHRFHLKEVDITQPGNKEWYEKYKNDIPVFHVAELFLFKHRVDVDVLEKVLKDYEKQT